MGRQKRPRKQIGHKAAKPHKRSKPSGLCERCHKVKTTNWMDHFALTGEYVRSDHPNAIHFICENCDGVIEFEREIRRQVHEYASEDEQISGDYED